MTSSLSPPFATTRWSVVAAAGHGSSPEGQRALGELCATYWYPLYAYLRRRGLRTDEAQDVTQSFFAELLERDRLQRAEPQRGRFR
ncbi:MAG: RNA polymerase subunit sigma-24, partial [Pirellulaceae bacterium]